MIIRPLADPTLDHEQWVYFLSWVHERAALAVSVDPSFSSDCLLVGTSEEDDLDSRHRLMIYAKPDITEGWACTVVDLVYRIDVWLRGITPPFRVREATIRCMSLHGEEPQLLLSRVSQAALVQRLKSHMLVTMS